MIKYENDCCGCAVPGYPCRGPNCPLQNVAHYYCDHCGEEMSPDEVYKLDDDMLCESCLLDRCRM